MEKIQANLVIEILGRPKEHLIQALATLVGRLETENGIKVINQTQHEPIKVPNSQNLFTTFAEIEAEFDKIETYLQVLFAYMPSHSEIIKPEKIPIANTDLNELGNALVSRLHSYDAITKNALMQNNILKGKIQEYMKDNPPKENIVKETIADKKEEK